MVQAPAVTSWKQDLICATLTFKGESLGQLMEVLSDGAVIAF